MKKILILIIFLFSANFAIASEVVILHTSDIHGRLEPIVYNYFPDKGGYSRRVTYFNKVRSENKNVLLLDSGDYFQGSLFYRVFKGKESAKLLKYAHYDAIS